MSFTQRSATEVTTVLPLIFFMAVTAARADEPPASPVSPPSTATTATMAASPVSATTPTPLKSMRVALTDLSVQGVDPRTMTVFRESLLVEMRKLQRVSVLGTDEVRAMLDFEAQKQLAGCAEGNSCLAELADALGADAVIVGGVVNLGDETVVTLKRVDQQSAAVSQQLSKRLQAGDGEELLAVVGDIVAALFPEVPLRAGEVRGVSDEIAVRLHPPPLPPWAFWTTLGASGALASSTLVSATWWAASQQGFRDAADQARKQATPGLTVKEREDTLIAAETTTWALAGATLVGIVATGLVVPFVDWENAGASTAR